MPIYEYTCSACGQAFSHFFHSIRQASESTAPPCPMCGAPDVRRVVSQVAARGERSAAPDGGTADAAPAEIKSITSKATIEKLRSGRKK